jgi:hypothetical protein
LIDERTEVVFFHWSGHAEEIDGKIVLAFVDSTVGEVKHLELSCVLETLSQNIPEDNHTLLFAAIDACRSGVYTPKTCHLLPRNRNVIVLCPVESGQDVIEDTKTTGLGPTTVAMVKQLFADVSLNCALDNTRDEIRENTKPLGRNRIMLKRQHKPWVTTQLSGKIDLQSNPFRNPIGEKIVLDKKWIFGEEWNVATMRDEEWTEVSRHDSDAARSYLIGLAFNTAADLVQEIRAWQRFWTRCRCCATRRKSSLRST